MSSHFVNGWVCAYEVLVHMLKFLNLLIERKSMGVERINYTVWNLRNAHLALVTSSTTPFLNCELAVTVLMEGCGSPSSCSAVRLWFNAWMRSIGPWWWWKRILFGNQIYFGGLGSTGHKTLKMLKRKRSFRKRLTEVLIFDIVDPWPILIRSEFTQKMEVL